MAWRKALKTKECADMEVEGMRQPSSLGLVYTGFSAEVDVKTRWTTAAVDSKLYDNEPGSTIRSRIRLQASAPFPS